MSTRAGQLTAVDDQILIADRTLVEPALKDLTRPRRIACLRRQRSTGDVRRHAVMRHRAPWMILRRRLREPHVAGVTCQLSGPERGRDVIAVADLAACRIH